MKGDPTRSIKVAFHRDAGMLAAVAEMGADLTITTQEGLSLEGEAIRTNYPKMGEQIHRLTYSR